MHDMDPLTPGQQEPLSLPGVTPKDHSPGAGWGYSACFACTQPSMYSWYFMASEASLGIALETPEHCKIGPDTAKPRHWTTGLNDYTLLGVNSGPRPSPTPKKKKKSKSKTILRMQLIPSFPPLRTTLSTQEVLQFCENFSSVCSLSLKNAVGILVAIALNLCGTRCVAILTMLILPIPKPVLHFISCFYLLFLSFSSKGFPSVQILYLLCWFLGSWCFWTWLSFY